MKHRHKHSELVLILLITLVALLFLFLGSLYDESETSRHNVDTTPHNSMSKPNSCTLSHCFNLSRCSSDFKIYVYNTTNSVSDIYASFLTILKSLEYSTSNPNEACVFVSPVDALIQDKIKKEYVANVTRYLSQLEHWNHGRNHLIFNMFSGTWPDYSEYLDFDYENAILVRSSFSSKLYRPQYDIAFPLFYSNYSLNGMTRLKPVVSNVTKKYLLTFKGKRYLHGVGSDTRNALFHLNNNRDVLLLTTCKHGENWQDFKDDRCDQDNLEYDKHDYNYLMQNSVFCLVPRGRRLDSYRFLECLRAGCIPVILSNGLVLPFSEVLEWRRAVIIASERSITQFLPRLRRIPAERVRQMRQYCLFFYNEYFSSIETILKTTIDILRQRVYNRPVREWNKLLVV